MANIFEVKGDVLVRKVALRLKEQKIPKPAYVDYVKTSPSKERIPQDPDFWYFRCASVLRQVYINGPVGVSKLRTRFGSNKAHTVTKHHHRRAGGSIIKDAFDVLEKNNYIKKTKKGRVIAPAGKSLLDKMSNEILKEGA